MYLGSDTIVVVLGLYSKHNWI
uniref:Uncharacterized protein n=1 Tax=Anguilla anguilla TaxID=7936 RepID=A0A0E9W4S7_ANGAN